MYSVNAVLIRQCIIMSIRFLHSFALFLSYFRFICPNYIPIVLFFCAVSIFLLNTRDSTRELFIILTANCFDFDAIIESITVGWAGIPLIRYPIDSEISTICDFIQYLGESIKKSPACKNARERLQVHQTQKCVKNYDFLD